MRAGKGVVARYINWPYKNPVDGRINLTGFSRAHDLYQSLSRAYFRGEVLMSPPKELPPPADIFQINYPSRALREELEGTVTFSIVWGADGRPTSCTVIRSSGHLVLDDAACKGSMMWGRKPKGAPDIQEFDHQFKLR
jgi:TonB family protein